VVVPLTRRKIKGGPADSKRDRARRFAAYRSGAEGGRESGPRGARGNGGEAPGDRRGGVGAYEPPFRVLAVSRPRRGNGNRGDTRRTANRNRLPALFPMASMPRPSSPRNPRVVTRNRYVHAAPTPDDDFRLNQPMRNILGPGPGSARHFGAALGDPGIPRIWIPVTTTCARRAVSSGQP
jgi:hypothetical protein